MPGDINPRVIHTLTKLSVAGGLSKFHDLSGVLKRKITKGYFTDPYPNPGNGNIDAFNRIIAIKISRTETTVFIGIIDSTNAI